MNITINLPLDASLDGVNAQLDLINDWNIDRFAFPNWPDDALEPDVDFGFVDVADVVVVVNSTVASAEAEREQ